MNWKLLFCGCLTLAIPAGVFAQPPPDENPSPLKNAVILVIRHAEKPESGSGLNAAGEARAKAYVNYFRHFTLDGQPLKLDHLFAARDSTASHRPRLTLEPLAKDLGLTIDSRFSDNQFRALARDIQGHPHGTHILICWHHEEIPQLLGALGADPNQLLPRGKWPDDVFGWLIQLRYDAGGHLMGSRCINENLSPDESGKPARAAPG
jgi:hypothetical protein